MSEACILCRKNCATTEHVFPYPGDLNPIHRNLQAAGASGFRGLVVPGNMMVSMFPAIIGTAFPGAVYASQTAKFRSPALVSGDRWPLDDVDALLSLCFTVHLAASSQVGQQIVARVTVSKRKDPWVVFDTTCTSPEGATFVVGEAMARIPTHLLST